MRLYTCCPNGTCGTFQSDLNFLHSWGIEPPVDDDGEGHFLEFDVPECWCPHKTLAFRRAFHKHKSLLICCELCGSSTDVHACLCLCGNRWEVCADCLHEAEGCPDCQEEHTS